MAAWKNEDLKRAVWKVPTDNNETFADDTKRQLPEQAESHFGLLILLS
jgi:hypothetical protein